MKRFLATACAVGAAFSLTGCLNTSASAPTTMEELYELFESNNLDNVTIEGYEKEGLYKDEMTVKIDGSNYYMESDGEEMYISIKGTTATMYMEEDGEWFYMSNEFDEDDMEGMFGSSAAEDIFGEGVTPEDFEQDEDGNWIYSEPTDSYYYSVFTVTFTDGAVEITEDEYSNYGETATLEYTIYMKMFDFGNTKVTLPNATQYEM